MNILLISYSLSDLNIQEEDSDTVIIADHGDISIGGYSLGTSASYLSHLLMNI